MKMRPTVFICLLFLSGLLTLSAQSDFTVESRFYGVEDGLSNKGVQCLLKDRQGFLWIGTSRGLNRFDGYRFKVFDQSNASLPFDNIHQLWEDADGWLWVFGNEHAPGTFQFNPVTYEVRKIDQLAGDAIPLSADQITHSIATADGALWLIGKHKKAIVRYHPGDANRFVSIGDTSLVPICPADRQSLLCLQQDRLVTLHPDGTVATKKRIAPGETAVLAGRTFAPYQNGFVHVSGETNFYAADPTSILPPFNTSIAAVNALELYFVISNDLYMDPWTLWHRRSGTLFHMAPYLADGAKSVLAWDNNKIWVGGHNGLLLLNIKPLLFTQFMGKRFFDTKENKSCRGIWSNGKQLYVHLDEDGLFRYDITTGRIDHLFRHGLWGHFSLLHENNVLYGGLQRGLYRIDLRTEAVTHWELDNAVLNFYRLPDQTLLCGTPHRGLFVFDEAKGSGTDYTRYNEFLELAQGEVGYVAADSNGLIWVCADSGFYALDVDRGVIARYWSGGTGEYYLPAVSFRHFMIDRDGMFWLSTRGHGIILWDRSKGIARKINHADGLSSNEVYAVYEDAQRQFWVSTDHGLNQIDKASMHLKFWNVKDGIAYNEFNKFSHFQDDNGILYFGGLDGVTRFDPDQFKPVRDADPEPFQFCEMQVFNSKDRIWEDRSEVYRKGLPLELHRGDNLLRIDFALLDLDQPDDIRYSWQLSGLDTTWHQLDYPSLQISRPPYGDYELRIRAIPSQGIWKASELLMPVHVIPPIYMRPWAWMLAVLLLGVGIWQYGRWRAHAQKQLARQLEQEVARQTATIRQQTEELKQLDELKTRFFANVSHDLRTPLTLLLGPVGSVLNKNKVDASDRSSLEMAHNNGQQLLHLVDEILDLGKLTAGTLAIEEKEVLIAPLFRRLCSAFSSHADRLGIQYTMHTDIAEDVAVTLDDKKFGAITNNLLSNAFKFTASGGHVTASLKTHGDQLDLQVSDTGRGIHPDDLPHIFERYYQSRRQDAPLAGGSGIGLALCKEYAELLGGSIAVNTNNTSKTGSTFAVRLPVQIAITTQVAVESMSNDAAALNETANAFYDVPVTPASGSHAILIAEDHDDLRRYIESVLSPFYTLHLTTNGQEAISFLENLSTEKIPSLILSDIMMPFMDGFQLAERLKADDRFRHIPMVMLTARADMKDKLRALRIGVDDYLLKPFAEEELLSRIHNLVRNATARKEADPSDEAVVNEPVAFFNGEDQEWLGELERVVMKDMGNFNLSADMLATTLAMSRTSLFRRVKKLTGLTAQQYVTEVRFRVAREWLESRRYATVKSVAHGVGLRDVEHFSRQFRDRFGKLPSAYLN
jgi:signal transduction histidine kinase/DNA-binding response OmpR family regulator/ligand-binding sensor domain-containing protein